jgi:hypothetical protein
MLNANQAGGASEGVHYNLWLASIPTMAKPSGAKNPSVPQSFLFSEDPTIYDEAKDDSLAWFASNLEILRRKYGRRWILIKDSDVLDSSDDPVELHAIAEKKGIISPYITKIPPSSTVLRTAYGSQ